MQSASEYKVVVDDIGANARDLLANASGLSASRVSQAMACGAVWLRTKHGIRRLRRRSASLQPGDELFLNYDPSVLAQTVPPATLVHDGGRWSVWHKPAGMRSQGSRWGDHTTLGRYAERHLDPERTAFIVHRLDMAAQGLMLLAHDKKAAAALSKQFAARSVDKSYHAEVHGKFPKAADRQTYSSEIDGKAAETSVARVEYNPDRNSSLVEASIATGRKHQVRRHLSEAGFPIIGDRLYGKGGDTEDLRLQATYLALDDPETGERVNFSREPEHWK